MFYRIYIEQAWRTRRELEPFITETLQNDENNFYEENEWNLCKQNFGSPCK